MKRKIETKDAGITAPSAPLRLNVVITGRCNLECPNCASAGMRARRSDLSTDRWWGFFEELGRVNVEFVTIGGGEPLVRSDLFVLLDCLHEQRISYEIVTNGTLLDETTACVLAEHGRPPGLRLITVELAGATARVHNRLKPRSFARILRGLTWLRQSSIPTRVRVTLTRRTAPLLEAIGRLVLDEVGVDQLAIAPESCCKDAARRPALPAVDCRMLAEASAAIRRLGLIYNGRLSVETELPCLTAAPANVSGLRREAQPSCAGFVRGDCSRLTVLNDGTIVPCARMAATVLGRIGETSPEEILRRGPYRGGERSTAVSGRAQGQA